jgi:putative ABC transport system permease protein
MRRLFLKLVRRRRLERDLAEEMAFHREMAAAGGNPLPFGNRAVIADEARDLWRFTLIETLWHDVVYSARGLTRTPGFALTAIVTLSLGIAANVLVFGVADAALFKPLPYRDPNSLVYVQEVTGRDTPFQARQVGASWRQVEFFRALPQIFSEVVPFLAPQSATVDPGTESAWRIGSITPDLLALLGIQPQLGRGFRADEAGQDVVLLSDTFWRRAYAADRRVVGQHITVNGRTHVIAGVMPPTFKWHVGDALYVAGWRPLDEGAQP